MGTTVRQHMGTLRPFLCLQRTAELRGPVSVVLSLSALPAAAQTVMFSMLCFCRQGPQGGRGTVRPEHGKAGAPSQRRDQPFQAGCVPHLVDALHDAGDDLQVLAGRGRVGPGTNCGRWIDAQRRCRGCVQTRSRVHGQGSAAPGPHQNVLHLNTTEFRHRIVHCFDNQRPGGGQAGGQACIHACRDAGGNWWKACACVPASAAAAATSSSTGTRPAGGLPCWARSRSCAPARCPAASSRSSPTAPAPSAAP